MVKNTLILFIALVFTCVKAFGSEEINRPIEAKTFYVDDTSTNMKVSRASAAYSVKTIIENCFDENNIGKEAWLMTADGETQLSVTLSYPENDTRHKITSQEVSFYFYKGSNIFTDNNKELITDIEHIVGSYTTDNTTSTATVTLTAPKYYFYTTNAYYQYYVVINVHFENGGSASVAKSIGISRPGVIILHGLNDSLETFLPMKEYLVNSGQFISSQIFTMDYRATNTSSFADNTNKYKVVKKGLRALSKSLLQLNIASTKYDMVGHSMGGILERLYCQEIDNKHTNKLITLNTPHFGAPLGNRAPTLFAKVDKLAEDYKNKEKLGKILNAIKTGIDKVFNPNDSRQAVADLAIGSNAIKKLNSHNISNLKGIPIFAVGTSLDNQKEYAYVYSGPSTSTEEFVYLTDHLLYNGNPKNRKRFNYLFGENVSSDAIVSVESQRGGLDNKYCSIFLDPLDSFKNVLFRHAFHCNSPKWKVTQNEIRLLLLSEPDEKIFCMTGFGTQTNTRSSELALSEGLDEDVTSKYITELAEPKPSSYIHLSMSSVLNEDYTHTANISTSNDMLTTAVFATLSDNKMIADYDKDIMNFNLEGYEDEVTFYAIGRTNYNALVIDSIKVNLKEINGIKNVFDNKIKVSAKNGEVKVVGASENYHIQICDVLGRVLLSQNSNANNTYAHSYKDALLFVTISQNGKQQTYKVLTK